MVIGHCKEGPHTHTTAHNTTHTKANGIAPTKAATATPIELPTAVYNSTMGVGWWSKWEYTAETIPQGSELPIEWV